MVGLPSLTFISYPYDVVDFICRCTYLYDTLRPKLIHETNLDFLCELIDILKVEVLGEQLSRRGESLAGLRPTLHRILADVHERLTFRARTHIRDEVGHQYLHFLYLHCIVLSFISYLPLTSWGWSYLQLGPYILHFFTLLFPFPDHYFISNLRASCLWTHCWYSWNISQIMDIPYHILNGFLCLKHWPS